MQSTEEFEGATVSVVQGDYSQLLARTNVDLVKALVGLSCWLRTANVSSMVVQDFVANENQKQMIGKYVEHFPHGRYKCAQGRLSSLDQGRWPRCGKVGNVCLVHLLLLPCFSYIGFIENYRDPVGVRSEFEGIDDI